MVIPLTIGHAISLIEILRSEWFLTILAGEVFNVPDLTQGSDYLAYNGLVASCTEPFSLGADPLFVQVRL